MFQIAIDCNTSVTLPSPIILSGLLGWNSVRKSWPACIKSEILKICRKRPYFSELHFYARGPTFSFFILEAKFIETKYSSCSEAHVIQKWRRSAAWYRFQSSFNAKTQNFLIDLINAFGGLHFVDGIFLCRVRPLVFSSP